MIKGRKTIALAIATLVITSSSIAFADTIETNIVSTRENVKESKLAGIDRYKTAVAVSKEGWSKANKAIIVGGEAISDALCASPLADEYDAPILLTEKNKVNDDTLAELKRLGVKQITLVDSDRLISISQDDELKKQGFQVERIGGIDRVDTSVKVAYKLKDIYAKKNSSQIKTVFLANGVKGLVDATSVSSPAGIKDAVILYTNGTNLNGVKSYIETSSDEVYIIGGTSVISQEVENELRRTNKKITRLAGETRNDTNAKVINEFFPNKDTAKIYVAKDGMGAENQLVDGLAVGSLASKNNSPVVLASDNLGSSQQSALKGRSTGEVVQVGEGRNTNPTKQAIGIINAIAQPEAEDGMKLPTIQFATEQNLKMTGNGGYNRPSWNVIQGDLYVKYGNASTRPHSYGSKNQAEYDKVIAFVKDKLKTINFRLQSDWVYLNYHLNGGRDDNYIDSVLQKNGTPVRYKDWRVDNKYLITGLEKGIVSREDAEKLAIYNSAISHVKSSMPSNDLNINDGTPYSAMDYINGRKDCDSIAQFNLIVGDLLGLNGYIAGSTGHQDTTLIIGRYHWVNGRTPSLNTGDDVFQKLQVVYEAPTY